MPPQLEILNYMKVADHIHTSGQPKENEFKDIAFLGIKTIINLAMPDSDAAIADEVALITSQGMNCMHIPVAWKKIERRTIQDCFKQ